MVNEEELNALHIAGGVELMKASAGSGKTYNLAREYIRLLLTLEDHDGRIARDPYSYRHILAVTFTNKATAEMKSRIIEELDILASDAGSSPYSDYLKKECGYSSEEELRRDSAVVLANILNDYGAFHISTIDSFFQQTLRAFAREIGQVAEYQVELDRDSLVAEAADRVLDSLSEEDGGLLRWLSSSTIEQMENGRGFNLEGVVGEFAKGYMSDGYKAKAREIGMDEDKVFSEKNIAGLRRICKQIVSSYDADLKAAINDIREAFIPLADVSKNLLGNIGKLSALDFSGPISLDGINTLRNCAEDGSKCFTGKKAKEMYGEAGAEAASDLLKRLLALDGKKLSERNTAKILESQVYVFRVAGALKTEFEKLLKEKNVLSLNDTNEILRDIIGGTEIPFIYEKLGVRLRHFLLDEFQDTSVIQWDNFMPILRESISQGCYNLIVGDVKQSIYRWRDTDWRIIDSRVGEEMPRVLENSLDTNWRSAENIVCFNNDFYKVLAGKMDRQLSELDPADEGTIGRIYSDVAQKLSGAIGVPGCVELTFCEGKDISGNVVRAVVDAHENKGFALKDIAVIVRSNSQGAEAASALISEGIAVVTNDSLVISSSQSVRRVVARLYRCCDPDENTMSFYESDFDPSSVDGGGSILALSEALLRGIEVDGGDTSYVLAFLDMVRDFEKKNGNSLSSFLKYWEEEGASKSISSPDGSEAVTVITIHKVKGLAYPCVVLPFPRKGSLMKSTEMHWECPDLSGSALEKLEPSLYRVTLSEKSQNDLFYGNMLLERRMQYVDTANMWYVATTRASQMMYMVAPLPSARLLRELPSVEPSPDAARECDWPHFSTVSEALYIYASLGGSGFEPVLPELTDEDADETHEVFRIGELERKWVKARKSGETSRKRQLKGVELQYVSYSEGCKRNRLKMSEKAREFFFPEEVDADASSDCRRHGTIVHSVLENVNVPSDLANAVDQLVFSGLIDGEDGLKLEKWLSMALASVEDRGWFSLSGDMHRNERSICDPATGAVTRPDRVVVKADGSVDIVDYKTGAKSPDHLRQVSGYMDSYRRMGYAKVSGYVWYIGREVVPVQQFS